MKERHKCFFITSSKKSKEDAKENLIKFYRLDWSNFSNNEKWYN